MKKINLVHLITGIGIGGAEKVVFDLCRYANKDNFDPSVLVLGDIDTMLPSFQANHIPVRFIKKIKSTFRPWRMIYKGFLGVRDLWRMNKEKKIDVLHAHLQYSGIIAILFKIFSPSTKVVFTSHNHNLEFVSYVIVLFLTKMFRDMDIIFSEDMHNNVYKKNATVIPNGICTEDYEIEVPQYDRFTFVTIGRLVDQKNHMALIEPIKKMKEQGYDFEVLFAGEGVNRPMIEQAIQENQLENQIKLLGNINYIPRLCNEAHCLLLPSIFEGLPIVLLEAGASTLPVITTQVGSIASLINDESCGYIATNEAEFTQKMKQVMDHYDEATSKATMLNTKVKDRFDLRAIVAKHESLYQQLVGQKQAEHLTTTKEPILENV